MSGLLRWETEEGSFVAEVDERDAGFRSASMDGAVRRASMGFEEALADIRNAAETALRTFRDEVLRPDGVEIEFGVKLNAAAGAVLAKASAEAHLKVKLTWTREPVPGRPPDDAPEP